MKNNVLIIGGGPAGLEAASGLQRLGYNVILVERTPMLGGHLASWDRLFPDGASASAALDGLLGKMDGVKCFTDTEVQSINRLDKSYNVILSNGITVLADAVLVASGFDLFKAERKEEYGYGIYDRVITNADLEAWFSSGSDVRIDNPKKIGFVHCVGSRDEKSGCRACSKVCCATAVKQACEMRQAFPDAQIYCFYMDLRMFGRHYEDLYLSAQKDYGVRFIRGRVAEVSENVDGSLLVKAEDTVAGKPLKVTLDLLVLMAGMRPSAAGKRVGDLLEMPVEDDGFFAVRDGILAGQRSQLPGVFLAGAATGPKTLPETLAEARGAVVEIDRYLADIFPDAKNYKALVSREMVDFGFGLVPSSRINLDLFDREKFDALAAVEPDVRKCMACGSCTAVCTAGQFVPTSLRSAIEELHNGHPDKALDYLKGCQLCGKCSMVCPRGINTRHLILSITKIYGTK